MNTEKFYIFQNDKGVIFGYATNMKDAYAKIDSARAAGF